MLQSRKQHLHLKCLQKLKTYSRATFRRQRLTASKHNSVFCCHRCFGTRSFFQTTDRISETNVPVHLLAASTLFFSQLTSPEFTSNQITAIAVWKSANFISWYYRKGDLSYRPVQSCSTAVCVAGFMKLKFHATVLDIYPGTGLNFKSCICVTPIS